MLPKKGNLNDPANYRPIALLPILYKLFSKMLYNRIMPHLNARQSDDQCGFRPGCWLEDGFAIYEGIVGNAIEFNLDIWICSIDSQKAFDRIAYASLFQALRVHGLPEYYIHLLIALYSNQRASVHGSEYFEIARGVKQGDIISPILFNCALEVAFSRWKRNLSDHGWLLHPAYPRLTNSRYADDIFYMQSQR